MVVCIVGAQSPLNAVIYFEVLDDRHNDVRSHRVAEAAVLTVREMAKILTRKPSSWLLNCPMLRTLKNPTKNGAMCK